MRLLLSALLVVVSATTSFGQEFTENFEGGIPASWTIHDNFPIPGGSGIPASSVAPWTVNTLEGMLNYTGGTGLAATASSYNHSGQYDVSLITPPFEITSDPGGALLRYTINYQRVDAFEAFDTNISINGDPWITVAHDTSSLGPSYGTGPPKVLRGIDMGFFGAMPGDMARVEFRYYSTYLLPMVRNEYVEIDNVRFPTEPVPEPSAVATLAVASMTLLLSGRYLRHQTNVGAYMQSASLYHLLPARGACHAVFRK